MLFKSIKLEKRSRPELNARYSVWKTASRIPILSSAKQKVWKKVEFLHEKLTWKPAQHFSENFVSPFGKLCRETWIEISFLAKLCAAVLLKSFWTCNVIIKYGRVSEDELKKSFFFLACVDIFQHRQIDVMISLSSLCAQYFRREKPKANK